MNLYLRKILVVFAFIINVILGKYVFNYFFDMAWGPDHYGGILVVTIKSILIGGVGGYFLALLPSLIWPNRTWIWCFGYPFSTLFFGCGVLLTLFFGHWNQLNAAIFWFGNGIIMALLSSAGGQTAKKIIKN
jgi:hypothetical protein